MHKAYAGSAFSFWSNWSRAEAATAIWTNIVKNIFYTASTEGAFIAANAGVAGIGRQIFIAEFAIWSKLQHGIPFFTKLL